MRIRALRQSIDPIELGFGGRASKFGDKTQVGAPFGMQSFQLRTDIIVQLEQEKEIVND
jgi:hypothetical protein